MSDSYQYRGQELEIFALVANWQRYVADMIADNIGGEVLEVGAGIGTVTAAVNAAVTKRSGAGRIDRWLCLEPDPRQASVIEAAIGTGALPVFCSVEVGTLAALPPGPAFDSIVYADVLEHIDDDSRELSLACARLKPGGRVVVMAPAHQFLFSRLDEAAGHFRRYDQAAIERLEVGDAALVSCRYLDCVGMLASLANRALLRQAIPTRRQLKAWDGVMVPLSRVLDPIFAHRLGKSLIAVWQKPAP